jgi:hypothetical protein
MIRVGEGAALGFYSSERVPSSFGFYKLLLAARMQLERYLSQKKTFLTGCSPLFVNNVYFLGEVFLSFVISAYCDFPENVV